MIRQMALTPKDLAPAAAVSAVAATMTALGLSLLAAPASLSERVSTLATQTGVLQRDFKSLSMPNRSDLRLVCVVPEDAAKSDLRTIVEGAAGQQHVAISDFRVGGGEKAASGVNPLIFHFSGTGSYEGVTAILRQLAAYQTTMFVDEADLSSNTNSVTLNFTGRMFCAD